MPVLKPGIPLEAFDPVIRVEIDPANPLLPGRHLFQLVVQDDSGNRSDPTTAVVLVVDTTKPNAILEGPARIEYMSAFELSGKKSFDIDGTITRYIFTLLD